MSVPVPKGPQSVIITLSPVQCQTAIQTLALREMELRSLSDRTSKPGERGVFLAMAQEVVAVHLLLVQAYNGLFQE